VNITEQTYSVIQKMINQPSPANKRCLEQVLKLDHSLDKGDLIQVCTLKYIEEGTEKKMENFIGGVLRKTLRQLRKRPTIVSLDEDRCKDIPSTKERSLEAPSPTPEQIFLCALVSTTLTDDEVDVLLNNITRQELADRLGISYIAAKKRLARKVKKIRKDYDFLMEKPLCSKE
jgi:hypothetical protein